MARIDPAMPFYVNDWLSSARVACMTLEQQAAYLRLLCYGWASQEAAIPDDDQQLAVLSGMGEGWLKGGCQMVRVCFEPHPHKPGFLTNQKLFQLWQERVEWRRKSAIGGKNSGNARRKSSGRKGLKPSKGGSQMVGVCFEPKGNTLSPSLSLSPSSVLEPYLPPQTANGHPQKNGRSGRAAGIQGIDSKDLKDTAVVMAWLVTNGPTLSLDPQSHIVQREVLACAEESLSGKKPGGLFISMVKKLAAGETPSLSTAAEDRAKERHDAWLRLSQTEIHPAMQELADKLCQTEGGLSA